MGRIQRRGSSRRLGPGVGQNTLFGIDLGSEGTAARSPLPGSLTLLQLLVFLHFSLQLLLD